MMCQYFCMLIALLDKFVAQATLLIQSTLLKGEVDYIGSAVVYFLLQN